jgi:uncharacterized protein
MKKFFTDNKYALAWGILSLIVLASFGSIFLIAKTIDQIKQYDKNDNPYNNAITMDGIGEVVALPDVASFNFSISETSESVDSAQKLATEKTNKALDYLRSQGIDDKDIKTTSYNINPKYEWQQSVDRELGIYNPGKNILVGYEVTQNTDVVIRDTSKAGEILAGIGGIGISNVSGLQFKVDDDEALKTEARAKAIKNAKQKVSEVAKALDVKVVRVISFYENTDQPIPYGGYGMGGDMMESKVSSVAPEISTGENKIISKVSVTFEIK